TADMTLLLPAAEGTVPLRLSGGGHKLTIRRPPGVAARGRGGSGGHRLTLDTLHLGSARETRWETPDLEAASGRHDVGGGGGARRARRGEGGAGPPGPFGRAGTAGAAGSGWDEALSPEEYPTLAPLARRLGDPDPDARFEFGLQVLLDGLEPRLPSG